MKRIIVIILISVTSVTAGVLDTSKVVLPHKDSQSLACRACLTLEAIWGALSP